MLLENFKENWLGGKEWRELFAERRRELLIVMEQGSIEKLWEVEDGGVGVRSRKGDSFRYGFTTSFEAAAIERLIGEVSVQDGPISLQDVKSDYSCRVEKPFQSMDLKEKIDMLRAADDRAKSYGSRVVFRRIAYRETVREIEIVNSQGVHATDLQRQLVFFVQVAVSDPVKGLETGYEPVGWSGGLELFDRYPPVDIVDMAVNRALRNLESDWVRAGRMPVVISSEAGGTIIHEAVGHGLEGDLVYNNLSVYSGKLGQEVASPLVTIVDDATLECYRGSFGVDDEGTVGQRTVLIEKGVLKNYMTDRFYAEKLDLSPTGNGRRESYRYMPIVRMTNTFMLPGEHSVDDILNSVDEGLFVKKMGGGEVNTVSGDFIFEVLEAYMIRNGRIAEPVRGATLIGNGPEILKTIDMVANDIGFSVGTCGKDGQGVPVTDGMPTVRVPSLTVGGRVKNSQEV